MTQSCLRNKLVCRLAGFSLAVVSYLATGGPARAANLVEEFYLPLPEAQMLQACRAVYPAVTDTNFASTTSILVTGNGTVIYYDQWEDGYETDLGNPTQSTTQIWGDGNDAHGIPPGFAHNPAGLSAGTVIVLTNAVPCSPRNPGQIYFDGRDRIGANKALVVTRAGWPSPTGPVLGGAVVVQGTIDWGTNYVSPIGQDMPEGLFRYVGFFVMASQNGTTVTIDPDGSGPLVPLTVTLNQGESYFYAGVRRGGTVTATKPVEADVVCGDPVNGYSFDWFTLYSQDSWSSSYFTPVPSTYNGATLYTTINYFYNTSSNPITVLSSNLTGSGFFTIPAGGGYTYPMPTNSGASFTSAGGEPYTVLCTVATNPTNTPTGNLDAAFNWGYTPLPETSLTTEAVVGWAPGSQDYTTNGSPVWVTPVGNTTVYVAYHGTNTPLTDPAGNKYSTNFILTALQSKTIYVPGTNDQTGMKVYTLDGTLLSVAWGEDPAHAPSGNPGLDLGTPVLPFPTPRVFKSSTILTDAPPAGLSTNDVLLYTVEVDNKGLLPLGNLVVIDAPPPSLNYVSNSTTLNGIPVPDNTTGTPFPLDAPGYTIPIILSRGTSIFQYQATVVGSGSVINTANIPGYNTIVTNIVTTNPPAPALLVNKTILSPASGIFGVGQTAQFNLQVINTGGTTLTNIALNDTYPSNKFSFVSASIAPNSVINGQIIWTNIGSLASGSLTNVIVSLLATNTAALATNQATAVSSGVTNFNQVTFVNNANPTPAVTVNKTIFSPSGGKAGIGQAVQFNLQVVNSGYTVLTNLALTDRFPGTNFSFTSASVTPNIASPTNLVWTNLGSFASGQITNITVTFTVTNYSANVTNFATAAAVGGSTNTGSAAVALTRSGLVITKTVLSPTNQPVNLGSNIVFRIVIKNTGLVAVNFLPLEDTFSADYFQFVSATTPPNATAAGDLLWTNLVAGSSLAINASLTNDVTMTVTGGATPAYNTASVNYAVDASGNSVAPSSGVAAVNTAAAKITGYVYNDLDQSGTLTAGDLPLANVTLSVYSDPNGDGNPADGVLIEKIVSDPNGYYELLNLNTGAYVVVESLLPGYAGTAPTNNRLPIVLTTLTATNGNNFFQYQVAATNYATVNGTVWDDLSGIGYYQPGDFGLTNVEVDLIQDLNASGVVEVGDPLVQSVFTANNGSYSFAGVVPGRYIIHEIDYPGYVSTGDSQGANDNQIAVVLGNATVTNGNDFFDYYIGTSGGPAAVPDFASTLANVPVTVSPLLNDVSPGGYALTITNVSPTNGTAVIIGGTNVLFTPTAGFIGTATVGYTITNGIGGKATSLITVTVIPAADLAIGKTASTAYAAGNFNYTISVTNRGPASASSVVVTDTLPAGVTFVSASGSGATNNGVVSWSLGTLTNNQVTNLILTVTAPLTGTLTNVASVSSPTGDPNLTNNVTPPVVTSVTPLADVSVSKTGPAGIIFGTNFNYTITVSNAGPSTATTLSVTDSLPAGLMFLSSVPVTTTNASSQVIWPNLGSLTAGGSTNLTVTVISTLRGSVTNIASGGSPVADPVPTNNVTPPVITAVTNFPPVANSDSYAVNENSTNTLNPLVNDVVRTPGGTLSIIGVSATNGTATIIGTNIIFTPTPNFVGTATIGYTITDNVGGTNSTVITVSVSNVPPGANPDSYAIAENSGTNVFSPLLNDVVQTPGGILSIIGVSPTNGTAIVSGTNVWFVPLTNFVGVATIGYTITDNIGGTNIGLITVSVTNRPSVANPDNFAVSENSTNDLSPLVNDILRTPGGTLAIIGVSPTNGTAVISGTNVIFTPANNFTGTATIGYTISDNVGGTNGSLITVTVTNIPPLANPDSYAVSENSTNTFSPLANDVVRTPGGNLSLVSVSATNGTATISGTNVIYSPANNFTGTATISYTITDGIGGTNSSFISVSVAGLADIAVSKTGPATVFAAMNFDYIITVTNLGPGVAVSLSVTDALPSDVGFVSATPGATLNGSQLVWANLGPLAAGAATNLTVTVTAPISGGSLTNLASGGSPTSDPDPTNNTSSPVFTTVIPVADLAIGKTAAANVFAASNLSYTISVTNFGPSDADNVVVTDSLPVGVIFVSASGNGTNDNGVVNWNLGTLTNGQISSVTLMVTAPANGTLTNVASVTSPTSDPNPTNNVTPPVVTDVTPLADVSVSKTGPAGIIFGTNFSYTILVTNFGPSTAAALVVTDSLPAGLVFLSSVPATTTNSDNQVIWSSLGDLAAGGSTNLTVNVISTQLGSVTNIASGGSPTLDPVPTNNVTPPVVTAVTNNPPVANPDSYAITENTTNLFSPLVNDVVQTPGGSLSLIGVAATNGVAVIFGTNIVFTPAINFTGLATIGYTITDNVGGTNNSLITVLMTNIPPVANPDSYSVAENTANNILSPLVNDLVETPGGTLSSLGVSATNGTASISGTYVLFTPATNFLGVATIGYTITDSIGGTNVGLITVSVTNRPPVANPDDYAITENTTNIFSPLVNDLVQTPGGTLTIVSVSATNGTAMISGTNVIFVPATNFLGLATIGYTITDNVDGTNSSLISVVVTNLPPAANPDSYDITENTTNTFSPLANDLVQTPDGSLTILGVSATNGTASVSGTNVIFTPTLNFLGVATIGYTITDNVGGTNSSVITVLVTNIPPLANPDSYAVSENSTNTLSPLANDVLRTPGGTLSIISVSPTNGTANIVGTNVIFTPALNFIGTATIGYTITDNIGGTNSSFVTVMVTNMPPLANPDNYIVAENSGTNVLSPLMNDVVRTPGGTLALVSVSATNGTALVSGTNVLFAPATNFFGVATIGYTITDNVGGTNTSLITVNVTNVPPVANGQSVGTTENTAKVITLTGTDPNHLPLTFAIAGNPANGTLNLLNTNTGAVTYTPNNNFTGADSFTFRVNNGQANSAVATVSLTVTPVADLAVAQSGPASGLAGSNLVFTVNVTNLGPAAATNIVVTNQLASGFTFVSASASGTNVNNFVTWFVASLPANGVTNFTVTAFATEGGAFTNIASGASAVLDLNPTNNNGSLANAQSLTVITPLADVAVFKDGGTNVFAGQSVSYVITATNAGPSTASNVVVQDTLPAGAVFSSASGSYAVTNGVVTWNALTLAPGATTSFNLTLVAPASVSSFVNIASGTSTTADPNPTNNNGSFAKSRVTTKVAPSADLVVLLTGPATAITGSNFVYNLVITNAGPSTASNVVVSDSLPTNLVFISASSGGLNTNNVVTWPLVSSLALGASTNYTITVKSPLAGLFTNIASAFSSTFDPNPTNNSGVSPASQALTTVALPQFSLLAGKPVLNPQTGLYEETVVVTNTGSVTVAAFRLSVGGLRSGIKLWNATGTNGGVPYVDYNFPLNPSNTASLLLEFYNPSRLAFTNTLSVVAIIPSNLGVGGTNNFVSVNKIFTDTRTNGMRFVIEWSSVIGTTYTVLYATNVNAAVWYVATPSVTATANITQWYDDGPPKTASPPAATPSRFYRVIQY